MVDGVRGLGGEVVNPDREETAVEISAPAYIPDRYISDELLKLQMYKKIAEIKDEEEEAELLDELMDRFGDIPKETMNLIKISYIRAMAEQAGIARVYEEDKKIAFEFHDKNMLTPKILSDLASDYGMKIFIHGGVKTFIKLDIREKDRLQQVVLFLNKITNSTRKREEEKDK